jgi:hypothetical protein
MSDDVKEPKCKMDNRCPRKLDEYPESWCPLAVLRLKAIRNAGRELTAEEEAKLPGCPWAVNHQLANYCFFKYIQDFGSHTPPSEAEIAHYLNVSVDTVKKTQKEAIQKVRQDSAFSQIIDGHDGRETIIGEFDSAETYTIRK